jgi:hypothetical protein
MIYVLGDSSSTGTELADHLISSWPGHKSTRVDHESYKKWITNPARQQEIDEIEKRAGSAIFDEIEKTQSWPSQLSKITGIKVINQAIASSGPSYWPYRLTQDLREYSPDTVILQFTSLDREVLFASNLPDNIHPKFVTAGNLPKSGPEIDYFVNMKLIEDSAANFYKFLVTVTISQAICRSHGIKNIHVVSTFNFANTTLLSAGGYDKLMQCSDIAKAWHATGIDWVLLDSIQSCSSHPILPPLYMVGEMPNGHHNAATHRRFAEMIANKYILNTI